MLTVTLCPSVDLFATVPIVQPERKRRCGSAAKRWPRSGVGRGCGDRAVVDSRSPMRPTTRSAGAGTLVPGG
jgi:hypothetical protein